jgi:hypothetical protein
MLSFALSAPLREIFRFFLTVQLMASASRRTVPPFRARTPSLSSVLVPTSLVVFSLKACLLLYSSPVLTPFAAGGKCGA